MPKLPELTGNLARDVADLVARVVELTRRVQHLEQDNAALIARIDVLESAP